MKDFRDCVRAVARLNLKVVHSYLFTFNPEKGLQTSSAIDMLNELYGEDGEGPVFGHRQGAGRKQKRPNEGQSRTPHGIGSANRPVRNSSSPKRPR